MHFPSEISVIISQEEIGVPAHVLYRASWNIHDGNDTLTYGISAKQYIAI